MGTATKSDPGLYADLGQALKCARAAKGWSIPRAAVESRGLFTAGALASYERGDRRVRLDTLVGIAAIYRVPLMSLLPQDEGSVMASLGDLIARLEALRGVEA